MFGLESFHHPTISMSDVKNWAAGVRDQHLEAGTDPTESLVKISRENSLTPHQVGVLAGEINKTIHIAKYASAEDKYHAANFPLADAQKAINALQIQDGSEKIAFAVPDPICAKDDFDYDAAFGLSKEASSEAEQEKTASVETSLLRGEVKTAHMKLARMKQEQDRKAFMTKVARDNAEVDFIKIARQMVLSGLNQQERMKHIGTISHATKCAGLYEVARKPMAKLALSLAEEGFLDQDKAEMVSEYFLEKKADEIAPDELISEFMRANVVNGNNPILISLKTFKDADERAAEEANRKSIVDDRNLIFAQKMRAL